MGQIACVSAYDIMHDETKYPNAQVFDGLRFVKDSSTASEGEEMRGTTLTEGTKDFPIWGFGSKIWSVPSNSSLVPNKEVDANWERRSVALAGGMAH